MTFSRRETMAVMAAGASILAAATGPTGAALPPRRILCPSGIASPPPNGPKRCRSACTPNCPARLGEKSRTFSLKGRHARHPDCQRFRMTPGRYCGPN